MPIGGLKPETFMSNKNIFYFSSSFWVTNSGPNVVFFHLPKFQVSPCFFLTKHQLLLFDPSARGLPARLFDVWRYGLVLLSAPVTRWTRQPLPGRASVGWPGDLSSLVGNSVGKHEDFLVEYWRLHMYGMVLLQYVPVSWRYKMLQDRKWLGHDWHEAKKQVWPITPEIWTTKISLWGPVIIGNIYTYGKVNTSKNPMKQRWKMQNVYECK